MGNRNSDSGTWLVISGGNGKSRILFDFGAGKATAYDNACKLNIGMENIQYAVGSHGHYDHAGGYPEFVKGGASLSTVYRDGLF
ncbi:MAG: MBL fold metallo-hydrolase [Clostridium sp.]